MQLGIKRYSLITPGPVKFRSGAPGRPRGYCIRTAAGKRNLSGIGRLSRQQQPSTQMRSSGYGFLSEMAALRRCEDTGIVFIGPTAEQIAGVGDKLEARRRAAAACRSFPVDGLERSLRLGGWQSVSAGLFSSRRLPVGEGAA